VEKEEKKIKFIESKELAEDKLFDTQDELAIVL
jgi:hypothetical protein